MLSQQLGTPFGSMGTHIWIFWLAGYGEGLI